MPLARASRVGRPQESSLSRQFGWESRRTSSSVLANRPVALGVVSLAAWDTPASHGVPHAVAFTSIHPNGGARSRLLWSAIPSRNGCRMTLAMCCVSNTPTNKISAASVCAAHASVHPDAVRHVPFWCLMRGECAARNPPSAHLSVGMAQNELVTVPASSAAQTSAPGHRCLPPHKPLRQDRSRCRDQAGTGRDRYQRSRRCR